MQAVIGGLRVEGDTSFDVRRVIASVPHPRYDDYKGVEHGHDIAILLLDAPSSMTPVGLPPFTRVSIAPEGRLVAAQHSRRSLWFGRPCIGCVSQPPYPLLQCDAAKPALAVPAGTNLTAFGWGFDENDNLPNRLQQVRGAGSECMIV